ncbi:MFS transporter [Catenulispora subtropica]|uniref:MFS transporter n=1 Tax=Catenulispora subtropica TaxID=450798 RepID=A0ABN2RQ64_9ACTN
MSNTAQDTVAAAPSQEHEHTHETAPSPTSPTSPTLKETFGESLTVLRIRQFRLILLERLLSTSATGISSVALSFAVLAVTKSAAHPDGDAAAVAFVLAAQLAPMLVFTLVGGVLADRFRPQRVMMAANFAAAAGEGLAGLLVLTHAAHTWNLLLAAVLMGTGGALFYPASNSLTPRLVPAERMQAASSLSRLAQSSMLMLGSAMGGVLVTAFGPGWAMSLDAVLLLLGTLPMLRITVAALERAAEKAPGMLHELREGWVEVRERTWLWAVILCYAVVLAGWFGGFMVIGPEVAKARLGGAAAWATIISCDGLGVLLGGVAGLVYQVRRPMFVGTILTFTFALPPIVMGLGGPVWAIAASTVLAGFSGEYFMILWMVALNRHIPRDKLARVYSYDALGSLSASPLGSLVAGPTANAVGTRPVQIGSGVLMIGATALTFMSRQVRTLRADDVPTEPVRTGTAAADAPGARVTEQVPAVAAVCGEA